MGGRSRAVVGWLVALLMASAVPTALADIVLGPPKTLDRANGDGTSWHFTYYPDATRDGVRVYLDEAQADAYASAYADAAVAQYLVQKNDWGFEQHDEDGVFQVDVNGNGAYGGGPDDARIQILFKIEEDVAPFQYPDANALYRSFLGHEWHHHLQVTIGAQGAGPAMTEGGATYAEVLLEPANSHQVNSRVYAAEGARGWQHIPDAPNLTIGARAYSFGLFWGYVHANDGGVATIKKVYEEAADDHTWKDIPGSVTAALRVRPGAHNDFPGVYRDFAYDLVRRQNNVWGGQDWWEFLRTPVRDGPLLPFDFVRLATAGYGLHFVGLPLVGETSVQFYADHPTFTSDLVTKQGGVFTRQPAMDRSYYPAGQDDAVLVVARMAAPDDSPVTPDEFINFTVNTFPGDVFAPDATIVINGGAATTDDRNVALTLTCEDVGRGVQDVRYRNENDPWSAWEAFQAQKAWTLSAGTGLKTVSYECRDGAANVGPASDTITYTGL